MRATVRADAVARMVELVRSMDKAVIHIDHAIPVEKESAAVHDYRSLPIARATRECGSGR
jgi:hypothetical protein